MSRIVVRGPLGNIGLVSSEGKLVRAEYGASPSDGDCLDDCLSLAKDELEGYFAGELKEFSVPLLLPSGFRGDVYETLIEKAPYGSVVTYGELMGRGRARAVGTAMAENPLPIFVPCHRVVPASGGTGNYSGPEGAKEFLLDLERRNREDEGRT